MLRPRKQPDSPLAQRQRRLAEQERLLSERMSRLSDKLNRSDSEAEVETARQANLPVWRLEEDSPVPRRTAASVSPRNRNLGRQRQRDMIIFFIMLGALIVVGIMVLALVHTHGQSG
jgi:hypothetical protein